MVCSGVYVSVCLFSTETSYRITQLDKEMFQQESWKLIYFGDERTKVKVKLYKNNCRRAS